MQHVVAHPVVSEEAAAEMAGSLLGEDSYHTLIDNEDADVELEDGTPLMKYRAHVLPSSVCRAAYEVLFPLHAPPTNRHMATLGKSERPLLRDGTLSNTTRISLKDHPEVKRTSSAIIGFYERYARFPYCRATAFNLDSPELFAKAMPFIRAVDDVFKKEMPERYAVQMEQVNVTHPDFVINDTAFTTITVNKNWQSAVHFDKGDLPQGFGVMSALRAGSYTGGVLVFPRYGIGVNMSNGGVCLANVHEWHGNTPIQGKVGRYNRVSCVFYYRSRMVECGSAEEELQRVKNRQSGDPLHGKI